MYLRIVDETITYPYSIEQLREDNYNVSFPIDLTTELLSEWGVFAVQQTSKPNDYTKNIVEGTPTLIDGVYYQNWVQNDATEAEIANKIENKWIEVREIRSQLLTETDWTQLSDILTETKALYTSYRQDLRDITSQSNPFNLVWPVKP
jgi:hypothetical protein